MGKAKQRTRTTNLRPNYPQGNGRVERSFRTDDDEFYHVQDLPADFGGIEAALLAWDHVYESRRPHQALGYLTPDQFYRDWLAQQPQKKGGGVRHVLTQHIPLTMARGRLYNTRERSLQGGIFLAEVHVTPHESFEQALRRFNKIVQQTGILAEARRREHYESPTIRRKKKAAAKRRKSLRNSQRG